MQRNVFRPGETLRGSSCVGWKRGYYYSHGRYVGKDIIARGHASLDAAQDAIDREQRELAREQKQAEGEAFQEARQRAAKVDSIVSRGLEAAGFYRQMRHQWKRRKATMTTEQINAPTTEKAACDLAHLAEISFVTATCSNERDLEDSLLDKLDALRSELIGPGPVSAALRLAVEAAAYAWLEKWYLDLVAKPDHVSPALDRRRNWTGRRFLQALSTVERIRRLTRPRSPRVAVQIVNQAPALDIPTFELPTFELPKRKKFED